MNTQEKPKEAASGPSPASPPTLSLPKGGGAIRGMGEKFAANPVTGTGAMTIPIATSPGRSGFGPQLSLSYDSGAGNGPFGFGWSLSLPSITRKTDKGLPQYRDAEESDIFILSGAEDLVPVLNPSGERFADSTTFPGFVVHRYRPRIEGLFARIERWTNTVTSEIHWRSITKDNITTLYGKDNDSRIFDPADSDPLHPTRIFSWQICQSYDDKGNAIVYQYAAENDQDIDHTQANERNRVRTANRYLKHILYGNRTPNRDAQGHAIDPTTLPAGDWMFEVVFDYGEHNQATPMPDDVGIWPRRNDPFSTYRAGFEVRTYRLCQRVLMFHHFPGEPEVGANCLVRSTDFTYAYEANPQAAANPIFSKLLSATQTGYKRNAGDGYTAGSLPPLEFTYSEAVIQAEVRDVDAASLENLPIGLDGAAYQWVDLDGEGISGILTEQGNGWFYKRNLSPINRVSSNGNAHLEAKFAPLEQVATKPNTLLTGQAQFLDLAGDGQVDLVQTNGVLRGFYERIVDWVGQRLAWSPFRPFRFWPNINPGDPNLKFVDLTGDGHADILITEGEALTWHPSLAEDGYAPAIRLTLPQDEEKGPRLLFANSEQSIYLADLSGDGLTDLVRIRNGEVCYWPNLGYGRFGAKVSMDNAPWFDAPDQFNQQRIRLADIDGSGLTDILYLHRNGVRAYFNQSGNSWATAQTIPFPAVDNLAAVQVMDLLGDGTACLVWSSPLPGAAQRPMRYLKLMGEQKPHLLVKVVNNLGAETVVQYAPSTRFYLQDKYAGKPWITRLPFPVHVVERVETHDHISGNRFVTRYAYHHGYFDGEEREFRGFGMVEQFDSEAFAALTATGVLPASTNIDPVSHVPPVYTKTWFHTGGYLDREDISRQFEGEYYREPGLNDQEFRSLLLSDTILPTGLTLEEESEACRALKGMMLRQEVYADDAPPGSSAAMSQRARTPYTVVEQNFTISRLQPREHNCYAVFFTHPRETVSYHYERNPADPRVGHTLTLAVDEFGNVLKSVSIGYGRRTGLSPLSGADKAKQEQWLITYTESDYTQHDMTNPADWVDAHRTPLPCEARTYELTGFALAAGAVRFTFTDFAKDNFAALTGLNTIPYEAPVAPTVQGKRLIECVRTRYRRNDLTALLPKGRLQTLALPGESYKLAFTPGLLNLYASKIALADLTLILQNEGKYLDLDGDGRWWIPAGRLFYATNPADTPAQERTEATAHFFLPRRYRDPFGHDTTLDYDGPLNPALPRYDLLVTRTQDPLQNVVRAENNYRLLQPWRLTDPNGNRNEVAFDTLGMVAGTAVKGKDDTVGDTLTGFAPDLTQAQIDGFYDVADPHLSAPGLLAGATTRIIYDLDRFRRTQQAHPADPTQWLPVYAAILARETHVSDPLPPQGLKIQISFAYSDGFGREIQQKIQAEPGPLVEDGPVVNQRWVGSGWTIFNNKGKPVRQYEPFFSQLGEKRHHFEFGVQVGVSPVLFYDPVERVVATLHPNHTYEKVVFDPWQQTTYDVNDTLHPSQRYDPQTPALLPDHTFNPANDPDVGAYFQRLSTPDYLPTWYDLRMDAAKALAHWPDVDSQGNPLPDNARLRAAEKSAAEKAAKHAATPSIAHLDALGRPFLTIADNGLTAAGTAQQYATSVELDIEGNQRSVTDALDRIVMRYDYDLLGNRIHQASMEAGERWMLNDVAGKPIRAWDSRNHQFRTVYDPLRRPTDTFLSEGIGAELLVGRTVYGESQPNPQAANLRGKVVQVFDQAGVVTSDDYDFKGNLLRSQRQLAQAYKTTLNWSAAVPLEADIFTSRTRYDALNRPTELTAPDNSVIRPSYNEANLLERVEANLRGAAVTTIFVSDIDYDAKGQRMLIDYGNGVSTHYTYDAETFRLVQLLTQRDAVAFPDDCPQPPPASWPGCQVQNLHYTYDPVGNITHIRDDAQQTIYFRNRRVEPSAAYTYDAIYRLVEATGREHLGQVGGAPIPHSYNDVPRVGIDWSANDGNALGKYVEQYLYDAVGNFQAMQHIGSDPANPGWTRTYAYDETSQLEPLKQSNRLTSTTIGATTETYSTNGDGYDAHGNMLRMPQLQIMQWDFKDQLQMTQRQAVNAADTEGVQRQGERTYYVYDAAGQRVRKVTELANSNLKDERIYLGNFEIYRQHAGAHAGLVRETLHIMDDKQRVALVETRTQGNDPAPQQLIRYQFGNHLGSASLELDDQAQIISYEEYYPYGSTSYQAVRSQTETPKRYRYTSMERDEETGLEYHSARYYLPWLGRWISPDPKGRLAFLTGYEYCDNCPINKTDSLGEQPRPQPQDFQVPATIPAGRTTAQSMLDSLDSFITTDQRRITELQQRLTQAQTNVHQATSERAREINQREVVRLTADISARQTQLTELTQARQSIITDLQRWETNFRSRSEVDRSSRGDVITLAAVIQSEAATSGATARLALAYAWLNRTGGETRGQRGVELSHYQPLLRQWAEVSGNGASARLFMKSFAMSLHAATERLVNPGTDPIGGATHWVSPRAMQQDLARFRGDRQTQEMTRRRLSWRTDVPGMSGERVPMPPWATSTRNPTFHRDNFAEIVVPGVPTSEFVFYRGVK